MQLLQTRGKPSRSVGTIPTHYVQARAYLGGWGCCHGYPVQAPQWSRGSTTSAKLLLLLVSRDVSGLGRATVEHVEVCNKICQCKIACGLSCRKWLFADRLHLHLVCEPPCLRGADKMGTRQQQQVLTRPAWKRRWYSQSVEAHALPKTGHGGRANNCTSAPRRWQQPARRERAMENTFCPVKTLPVHKCTGGAPSTGPAAIEVKPLRRCPCFLWRWQGRDFGKQRPRSGSRSAWACFF